MAGRIPKDFIDQLLARTDLIQLIQARLPLKKNGKEYTACCPFHGEKTPSFTVSPSKQFYHCFGCGAHGSAISFLMDYEHLDYPEAIEALARQQGLEVPRESGTAPVSKAPKDPDLYQVMAEAEQFFKAQLQQFAPAQAYLTQRGLSAEMVERYGLGYSSEAWDALGQRFAKPYGQERLLACGLQLRNEAGRVYDRFRGRLMFPIRNRKGQVIGFGGRVLGEGTPKYLNSPETSLFHTGAELYGLYEARHHTRQLERLLVVEGYMDVLALAQFGISYAVATLGTATTGQHIGLLFRQVQEVIFCFDGDRAGREAAWRALEACLPELKDGYEVRFLFLANGEDPDTQIRKTGRAAFEAALDKAVPLSKFFVLGLKEQLGFKADETLHVDEDSTRFATQARRLLDLMPDVLLKGPLLQEIQRLGRLSAGPGSQEAQAATVTSTAGKWQKNRQGRWQQEPRPVQGVIAQRARDFEVQKTPVRYAIALLLYDPALALEVAHPEKLLEYELPGLELLVKLVESIEEQPHIHAAALLEQFRNTVHEKVLFRLAGWHPQGISDAVLQQEFRDCLHRIRQQGRQKALESLLQREQTQGLTPQEKHDLLSLLGDIHGGGK